ncbi:BRO family protein [Pseudomonas sp. F1_0610]|uniref:BRO-N domain-containing protein n=1 Tax=Pseudomonas sp. F1_0610 TaxID=3114284 RepID=UPI0039C3A91D
MTNTNPSVISLPTTISFHDAELTVINQQGEIWLSASDISRALGYAREDAAGKIYTRNADEFTSEMTLTPNLGGSGNLKNDTRIFSLRGAHLIAMFARTKRAKEFRKWVLDVLDSHCKKPVGQYISDPYAYMEAVYEHAMSLTMTDEYALQRKEISERAEQLVDDRLQDRSSLVLGGMRLLTQSDGFDGFTTQAIDMDANLLKDNQIAAYMSRIPMRYIPEIISAATRRIEDMCYLPYIDKGCANDN